MTTPTSNESQQWQQPSWHEPVDEAEPSDPPAAELAEPVAGSVLVPKVSGPPSVIESTLNVVTAVAWPVAIVLAIMGIGGWWLDLGSAFLVSAIGGAIAGELRKRRSGE